MRIVKNSHIKIFLAILASGLCIPYVRAIYNSGGKILTGSNVLKPPNPLEDISHTREIEGVLCQGTWIPKKFIETRLEEIAKSYETLKKARLSVYNEHAE